MRPDARQWFAEKAAAWAARAADLRMDGSRGAGHRAHALEAAADRYREILAAVVLHDQEDRAPVDHPPIEIPPTIAGLTKVTGWRGHWGKADMDPPLRDWLRLEIARLDEIRRRLVLFAQQRPVAASKDTLFALQEATAADQARRYRADLAALEVARTPAPPPVPVPFVAGPQMEMFGA